jgi:hypothetical protein
MEECKTHYAMFMRILDDSDQGYTSTFDNDYLYVAVECEDGEVIVQKFDKISENLINYYIDSNSNSTDEFLNNFNRG